MKSADEWVNEMEWGHIPETIEAIRDEYEIAIIKKIKHTFYILKWGKGLALKTIINAIKNVRKELSDEKR